jgi:hypothetical protein
MKTYILMSVLLLCQFLSYSQKQDKGDYTLEMQFSPLGSEPLKINGIKSRYFFEEKTAYRLSLYIGGKSSPSTVQSGDIELKNKTSNFDFTFRPGLEKHFDGTTKLSPYYGGEGFLGLSTSKNSTQNLWSSSNTIQTTTTKKSSPMFGLNIFSGTDFYFTEKFFLGIEMGFGLMVEGAGHTKTKYNNPEDPTLTDSNKKGLSSNLSWGPNYQGTIRLGYCFK